MIWAAKNTAHSRVMRSPKPMVRVPAATDTSPMPATHSTAAPTLATVGRLRATAHSMKGTMTQ